MSARSAHAYENQLVSSMLAKRRVRGVCEDCGGPTRYNGRAGKRVSTVCLPCAARRRTKWTDELIIDAIRRFAGENGRPPSSREWLTASSKPDYAPYTQTVQSAFGTWRHAIVAAGFPPPAPPGKYVRSEETRKRMSKAARKRWRDARSNGG